MNWVLLVLDVGLTFSFLVERKCWILENKSNAARVFMDITVIIWVMCVGMAIWRIMNNYVSENTGLALMVGILLILRIPIISDCLKVINKNRE